VADAGERLRAALDGRLDGELLTDGVARSLWATDASIYLRRPEAVVVARSQQLTGYCLTDSDIDTAIDMLKDDLDACGREMKRLLEVNNRGSLFEGWPKGGDAALEA